MFNKLLELSDGVKPWFMISHLIIGTVCVISLFVGAIIGSDFFIGVFFYTYPVAFVFSLISAFKPNWILLKEYKER